MEENEVNDVESFDDVYSDGQGDSVEDFDEGQVGQIGEVKKDEKSSKKEKKEQKDTKQEKDSGDDKEEVDTREDGENKEEEVKGINSKVIPGRVGDKKVDIPLEATIRTKVSGKNHYPTIKQLQEAYSAETAYSKKFEAITASERDLKAKIDSFENNRNHLNNVLSEVNTRLSDPKGNPIDGINYFLDSIGINTLEFNKRLMDSLIGEVGSLYEMDETERELYWAKKDNEFLNRKQQAALRSHNMHNANNENMQKMESIRNRYGVSEDDFVDAYKELEDSGYDPKELGFEAICRYSSNKESFASAGEIVEGFIDDIQEEDVNEFVSSLAGILKNYPEIEEQKAVEIVAKRMGYDFETEDDPITKLASKQGSTQHVDSKRKNEDEDFVDAFDEHYY